MSVQLGDFILEKRIGVGGMGQVFLGRQISLDRLVAVKVMPKTMGSRDNAVRRFEREAKAAANLVHPNVIQIYHFGVERDVPYFAMEYVEGKDLDVRMKSGHKFEVNETIDISTGVAQALGCAFKHNIVHRDIKPSNIMITTEGTVKVMDFGLAKAAQIQDQGITQDGMIIGTPHYMSPEQGKGEQLDHRSDIYSLGVVMYHLLTGELPFKADTPTAMIYQHAYEKPPPLREKNPDIPVELDGIVMKMLQKNPANRHQTPKELLVDLNAYKTGTTTREALRRRTTPSGEFPADTTVPLDTIEKKRFPAVPVVIALVILIPLLLVGFLLRGEIFGPAALEATVLPLAELGGLLPENVRTVMCEPGRKELIEITAFNDVNKPPGEYEFKFTRVGYKPMKKTFTLGEDGLKPAFSEIDFTSFVPTAALTDTYDRAEDMFKSGSYKDALGKYEQVCQIDPGFRETRARMAFCREKLNIIEEKDLKDRGIYENANKRYKRYEYEDALMLLTGISEDSVLSEQARSLERAIKAEMGLIGTNLKDARALLDSGDYDRMLTVLDRVRSQKADHPGMLELLPMRKKALGLKASAFAAYDKKDFRTAEKDLKELLALSPEFVEARKKYAVAGDWVRKDDARLEKIKGLISSVEEAFRSGRYALAIKSCNEILGGVEPGHEEAERLLKKVSLARDKEDITTTLKALDAALEAKDAGAVFGHFDSSSSGLAGFKRDFDVFRDDALVFKSSRHMISGIRVTGDTARVEASYRFEVYLPELKHTETGMIERAVTLARRGDRWLITEIKNNGEPE
jgi:tetratricopeptide (TPR) repeat protein/predicted Ser/Thr protein kinase